MRKIITLHHDGTVTYWSVLRQVWVQHAHAIDDEEMAALPHTMRPRVIRHLEKQLNERCNICKK